MSDINYTDAIRRGWKRIAVFAVATAAFAAAVSFAFPLRYGATMRLLMIQSQLSAADPYTAIKASERISDNLAKILYTTDFYDKVMEAQFNVDESYFAGDERRERRRWKDAMPNNLSEYLSSFPAIPSPTLVKTSATTVAAIRKKYHAGRYR